MGHGRGKARAVAGLVAMAAAVACNTEAPQAPEKTGQSESAIITNGGFETGAPGAAPGAPWTVQAYLNPGITPQTPQTLAGLNLTPGGAGRTVILNSATGPGSQPDPDLGATASLRWPRYGNQCALVNQHGNNRNINALSQTTTIAAGDVDPGDGLVHVRFAVAPVLQNPAHAAAQQPYYFVLVTDVTKGTLLYSDFNLSGSGGSWKTVNGGTTDEIDYTDWQLIDIAPGPTKIAMGDQVAIRIFGAGCSLGAHFGEVYVDGVGGPTVPGIYVEGTAPAQANAGANLTYTLTYKNGGGSTETGVTVTFTTPPSTTFQSISAAGLSCSTPAAGAAGTVTCTVGSLAAGASGTFAVTVNIAAGTTGTIVERAYQIESNQETALIGPPISTLCGCTRDSDCSAGRWCNESASACTPTLANGTALPTDAPHTNPTLNGTCTAQAGALVCTSAVCDTADSKCGYANGDGPCTAANGGTVCRSGACSANGRCRPAGGCNVDADCTGGNWCDESTHTCTMKIANGGSVPTDAPHTNPTLNGTCTAQAGALVCASGVCDTTDNKCGYANGDGPCTAASGGTVCRSGACSSNGRCEPAGGCNVDADCTGGNWCAESTHTCTVKIANGGSVPTDAPHTNPTLNGTCTAQAGALVCASGVCDTADNKCGYASGDGPCTPASGGTVCRSGACSAGGLCVPAGGCNVDADCTGGNWCDESAHACTPRLPNGGAIPTDPPHTSPTLNGTCTAAAGALVCASGVCDTVDNACGYANGDGPCSQIDGGSGACRSGACSASGTCTPAGGCNVDADCTSGHWCNETAHTCAPTLANGSPVPADSAHANPTLNGTCTAAAGALVCTSGVCDTADNACGYADGDGPCSAGDAGSTQCRSGICGPGGTCTMQGGSPDGGTDGSVGDSGAGADSGGGELDGQADADGGSAGDAMAGDGEATDAAVSDSGAAPDATLADAEEIAPDAALPIAGVVEGAGCSCVAAGEPARETPAAMAGGLVMMVLLLGRRRARREATGSLTAPASGSGSGSGSGGAPRRRRPARTAWRRTSRRPRNPRRSA